MPDKSVEQMKFESEARKTESHKKNEAVRQAESELSKLQEDFVDLQVEADDLQKSMSKTLQEINTHIQASWDFERAAGQNSIWGKFAMSGLHALAKGEYNHIYSEKEEFKNTDPTNQDAVMARAANFKQVASRCITKLQQMNKDTITSHNYLVGRIDGLQDLIKDYSKKQQRLEQEIPEKNKILRQQIKAQRSKVARLEAIRDGAPPTLGQRLKVLLNKIVSSLKSFGSSLINSLKGNDKVSGEEKSLRSATSGKNNLSSLAAEPSAKSVNIFMQPGPDGRPPLSRSVESKQNARQVAAEIKERQLGPKSGT